MQKIYLFFKKKKCYSVAQSLAKILDLLQLQDCTPNHILAFTSGEFEEIDQDSHVQTIADPELLQQLYEIVVEWGETQEGSALWEGVAEFLDQENPFLLKEWPRLLVMRLYHTIRKCRYSENDQELLACYFAIRTLLLAITLPGSSAHGIFHPILFHYVISSILSWTRPLLGASNRRKSKRSSQMRSTENQDPSPLAPLTQNPLTQSDPLDLAKDISDCIIQSQLVSPLDLFQQAVSAIIELACVTARNSQETHTLQTCHKSRENPFYCVLRLLPSLERSQKTSPSSVSFSSECMVQESDDESDGESDGESGENENVEEHNCKEFQDTPLGFIMNTIFKQLMPIILMNEAVSPGATGIPKPILSSRNLAIQAACQLIKGKYFH